MRSRMPEPRSGLAAKNRKRWYTTHPFEQYHPNMTPQNIPNLPRCGLMRRLAAILYDGMLLLALLFFVSGLHLAIVGRGEDASSTPDLIRSIFVVLSAFGFFAWFWLHGGQTLGMRAWRIRLQSRRGGGRITLWQALLRFLVAIVSWLAFGVGFFWSLFDKEKLTWHDRYSMSELVVIPREQAKKK
jgi:uncharacterized RDD family membrane protein YckC